MFKDIPDATRVRAIEDKFKDFAECVRFFPYGTGVIVSDSPVEFVGRAPRELYGSATNPPNYAAIARHYGIEFRGNAEETAALVNFSPSNPHNAFAEGKLTLAPVTSVDIAAAKQGKILDHDGKPVVAPFYDLAVIGGVFTQDDKLIVGARGRRFGKELTASRVLTMADDCFALAPGGGVGFVRQGNPLEIALGHEFEEELGISSTRANSHIQGVFKAKKVGPTGLKFVYSMNVKADSEEILDLHVRGLSRYTWLCSAGKPQDEVAEQLKAEGLAPDVWEHSRLEALSLDEVLLRLESMEPRLDSPLENHVCGIGVGAITTLLLADIVNSQAY